MKTLLLTLLLVPMMSFGQNVNIPDANFKNHLLADPNINTNGDSEIQVSEASAFTGGIYCVGQNISELTGIEAFTALTELECGVNQLTSLDVSNNTALTSLICDDNQLTSLDVSNNTALEVLGCGDNQITSLDVSNNTALEELGCSQNNLLTSLDLSNNSNLIELYCSDNQQLQCLNIKNGNNTAFSVFNVLGNPNLTCIEVDDVSYSSVNWTNIDSQTSFSTDCNNGCSNTSSISELNNTPKQLIKIADVLGRETPFKPNTPLIYVYDDGSIEKVFSVEY